LLSGLEYLPMLHQRDDMERRSNDNLWKHGSNNGGKSAGETKMKMTNEIEQSPRLTEERLSKPGKNGAETILVVEDEPDLLDLVMQVLEGQGYHVLGASSGRQALQEWSRRDHDIDLLLTDMALSDGVTGCELAAQLRTEAPHLRVIYSSGHTVGIPGTQLADVDEREFLAKPYRPSKLLEIVRYSLDTAPSRVNGN
jgi:CheY-like chemotaxis protein